MSVFANRLDPSHANAIAELEARIQFRLAGQVQGLQLQFDPSGVTLRGQVRTYYAKQLAQHVVMDATDLRILANDIVVS